MLDGKELREKIEKKLLLDFLTSFQRDFLSSILWRVSKSWDLSEKQTTLLQKIFDELDELELTGHTWDPADLDKERIKTLLDLSKSYSAYYLANYNPPLQKALRSLLETHLKISTGSVVSIIEKKQFDSANKLMKNKLKPLDDPKFFVGDLVKAVSITDGLAVVLSGPKVSQRGEVVYSIDIGGSQLEVRHDNLRATARKRSKKDEQSQPV